MATWQDVLTGNADTTESLAIPGGWLYRSVWEKRRLGQPTMAGSSLVFVPGDSSADLVEPVPVADPPVDVVVPAPADLDDVGAAPAEEAA